MLRHFACAHECHVQIQQTSSGGKPFREILRENGSINTLFSGHRPNVLSYSHLAKLHLTLLRLPLRKWNNYHSVKDDFCDYSVCVPNNLFIVSNDWPRYAFVR